MKEIERNALRLASKWYSPETLQHALRVADYAWTLADESVLIDDEDTSVIFAVAILHDIKEDTACPESAVNSVFSGYRCYQAAAIDLVTKRESDTYDEYINKILSADNRISYIVKKADLKDHLSQIETLTPKLIEKYLPYIGKFI